MDIIFKSREVFFSYIEACNNYYRSGHDLSLYRKIIQYHRDIKDLELILKEDDFFETIHLTLEAWNMDQRGARLNDIKTIKESILLNKPLLIELYKYKMTILESLENETLVKIIRYIGLVFRNLKIMESQRRIVGVSKALHFLLPDLVMPIDSAYTMIYFFGRNVYSNNPDKEFETFKSVYMDICHGVKKLNLTDSDVDGIMWNASVPKLIDNAIIGFFKLHEREKQTT